MKTFILNLALVSLALAAAGTARGESAPSVINMDETIITAEAADDAALYALPANAPAALVTQRKAIDELRAAFNAQRDLVAKLVRDMPFEGGAGQSEQVNAALELYRERLAALEDAEAAFVLDKDLFAAHGASELPQMANAVAANSK